MTAKEHIDFLEKTLTRLLSWIAAAHARVPPLFAINSAMLGLLAALTPKVGSWTTGAAILASLAAASSLLSLIMLGIATIAQTSGPKGSMIFFGGITSRDIGDYEEAVRNLTEDQYLRDLARQCHRNAEIASDKFKWVHRATLLMFVAFAFWLPAVFLLYVLKGCS